MSMYVLQSQPHIMSDMVIVSSVLLEPLPVSKVKDTLDIHKSVSLQIQLSRYRVSGRRSYMFGPDKRKNVTEMKNRVFSSLLTLPYR